MVSQLEALWAGCGQVLGDEDRATLNARVLLGVALRSAGQPELAERHVDAARMA